MDSGQMDPISRYNKARWEDLVEAGALFTRPWFDLTSETARRRIDPGGFLGDVADLEVLCLAGGGGQQSAAFALLGARVTVFDLSEGQLERDREAARHYGHPIRTMQGDIRDLSRLAEGSFDLVHQAYSLNFVPDCREVFAQVARVLRRGGLYAFWAANPFAAGMGTRDWNGCAYEMRRPYVQGSEITYGDEPWVFPTPSRARARIEDPREYRQLLSTLLNGLTARGFVLIQMREETGHEPSEDPIPGEWDHFTTILPPWFSFLARLMPEVFRPESYRPGDP
jgi:ubiquinone/menaquinone biosynthesis C-methylase UbiE